MWFTHHILFFIYLKQKNTQLLKTTMFGVKGKLLPYECDITDEHQIKAVFRFIGEKFDGIDLLVRD